MAKSLALAAAAAAAASADPPLACQPNAEQPMLPIFHIIGNVTKNADASIKLESINDCSAVTYHKGLYHVFHQCCQVRARWLATRPAQTAARLPRSITVIPCTDVDFVLINEPPLPRPAARITSTMSYPKT